jgi:isopenicillin-N N-acyltransferase-like protein
MLGYGDEQLTELGARVRDRVSAAFPALGEEIDGLASGSGIAPELLWAVNARTELIRGAGECSLVGVTGDAGVTLAQNWDWHPELAASMVVWSVEQDGRWFSTVTEAGMLAKLGLNDRGLAIGLNFLESSLDGGVDGLPVHVLLRVALQDCGSPIAALAPLMCAPVAASSCITVAGADGGIAAVELSPGGPAVVLPDADGVVVHTNHFLGRLPAGEDLQPSEHPGTLLRRWRLLQLMRDGASVEEALRCHFPAPEGVCRHAAADELWSERRATLLSLVIDPAAPSLRLAAGAPCEVPFRDVALPWS